MHCEGIHFAAKDGLILYILRNRALSRVMKYVSYFVNIYHINKNLHFLQGCKLILMEGTMSALEHALRFVVILGRYNII